MIRGVDFSLLWLAWNGLDLLFALTRQLQIPSGSRLGFLHECVKQNGTSFVETEHDSRTTIGQVDSNLPETRTERPAQGHPDRPLALHHPNGFTDSEAVELAH
jgi:hypothetical protein